MSDKAREFAHPAVQAFAAVERRGYKAAREQAAKVAQDIADRNINTAKLLHDGQGLATFGSGAKAVAAAIRAMKPEGDE